LRPIATKGGDFDPAVDHQINTPRQMQLALKVYF
jgi:hypothetical protein